MTLSSRHQSPRRGPDTPTLDTARTAVVRAAIRAEIEPSRGWWQFDFQPWHYWTAIVSAGIIATAFVALIIETGAVR